MSLTERLRDDMKQALRAGDKSRLGVVRMALAAIKDAEIKAGGALDEGQTVAVLEKMVKQRRESVAQYEAAGRDDLARKEGDEIDVLADYLPEPLSDAELEQLIDTVISETGAASMRDMGKVMGAVKARAEGRADMSLVSAKVKDRLTQ